MGRVSDDHPGLQRLPTAHTHDSHPDHKDQHGTQREANEVVYGSVHCGSESLLASSSQDSAVDTLGREAEGQEVSNGGVVVL